MNELQTREEFEQWLFSMDDSYDIFLKMVKEDFSEKLKSFTLSSLDILEEWLLSKFSTPDELLFKENKTLLEGSAIHIGEVIRKHTSGKWDIELKNEDDAYYGLPVVVSKDEKHFFDCPYSLTTSLLDRREKGWLKGVVEYIIDI
ncbi:MAG: hypothetical protein R2781_08020 [Flavobacteriaceae bacterium]